MFSITDKSRARRLGGRWKVSVFVKDKELKLEEIEAFHTPLLFLAALNDRVPTNPVTVFRQCGRYAAR
jgi:hypothetical protein